MVTRRREGDLIRLLGLASYIKEDVAALRIRQPAFRLIGDQTITVSAAPINARLSERSNSHLPRAILFGDSAFGSMRPFLPENFSRFVFVWAWKIDPALIDSEHPDIVIQDLGEMYLMNDALADPAELEDLRNGVKSSFQIQPQMPVDQ